MDLDQITSPNINNTPLYSRQVMERSTALKYRLSHFYTSLLEECVDRENRFDPLDIYHRLPCIVLIKGNTSMRTNNRRKDCQDKLLNEPWSDEKKRRHLQNLGQKEGDFLRVRRVRLSEADFLTLQVYL